jgi:outer membrane biosynthesis protein TonB
MMMKSLRLLLLGLMLLQVAQSQPVTGVWRGKVTRGKAPFATTYKVEVKLIKQGDSLTGTSYYYAHQNLYFRYAVKGYLDPVDASVHWWDHQLLEQKGSAGLMATVNKQPLAMQTDFNCPGSGIMLLDGKVETKQGDAMTVHLQKQEEPLFADGWDELIENWFYGGADPDGIAQAEQAQLTQKPTNEPPAVVVVTPPPGKPVLPPQPVAKPVENSPAPAAPRANPTAAPKPEPKQVPAPVVATRPATPPAAPLPLTTLQKWETRQRLIQTTLPLAGDSIELHFFDNAEIDGDSISLFLNGKLLFEHVRLSAQAFVLKLAVADMPNDAELAMVAENLGAIPPNTAFMMAYVNGQRYTARLESSENTTAVIKLQRAGQVP